MKELVHNIRGSVYLATYEHSHGTDFSVHKTYEGAGAWLKSIFDEYFDDYVQDEEIAELEEAWNVPRNKLSIDDILDIWPDITLAAGESEWMNIIELELQK